MKPRMHDWVLKDGDHWNVFSPCMEWAEARTMSEVAPLLERVESWAAAGDWAVGAVAYEAAPALDSALHTHPPQRDFPLAMFGRFREPAIISDPWTDETRPDGWSPAAWMPGIERARYDTRVEEIRARIAKGEVYQANYTFPLRASNPGPGWTLFGAMERAHQALFAAYAQTPQGEICSVSPELFFELNGDEITSSPMKGTARRGATAPSDDAAGRALAGSAKDQAENVMIADMVRNDLGRICDAGSIRARRLFEVSRHANLWQMTSTVEGRTDAGMLDIFRALFPAASITGAPKAQAMKLIRDMEDAPRGIYTGAIGYWAPGRRARFSVAIRTAWVDPSRRTATYGVGGGITWDSRAGAEYDEACSKGPRVETQPPFELLETMRWTPGEGFAGWPRHAARLRASADYFGYTVDTDQARASLDHAAWSFPNAFCRVRLRVGRRGDVKIEWEEMENPSAGPPWRLAMARTPVSSQDVFLYHKTTRRVAYDRHRAAHPGADDVMLWNERGELTETCLANVMLEVDGAVWTPPVECGLLAGTERQKLLAEGFCRERTLTPDDARRASRIWISNAVRGLRPAVRAV